MVGAVQCSMVTIGVCACERDALTQFLVIMHSPYTMHGAEVVLSVASILLFCRCRSGPCRCTLSYDRCVKQSTHLQFLPLDGRCRAGAHAVCICMHTKAGCYGCIFASWHCAVRSFWVGSPAVMKGGFALRQQQGWCACAASNSTMVARASCQLASMCVLEVLLGLPQQFFECLSQSLSRCFSWLFWHGDSVMECLGQYV